MDSEASMFASTAMPDNKDVLRPVDEASRHQAKSLIRDPKSGTPLISQVNVATDTDGSPGFLISELSAHFGALEADARCSLLFGTPGKGDPAAHPRITVTGHALRLHEPKSVAHFRHRFINRHPKSELYVDFGDFAFWRITPSAASLNGGFGKAYDMTASDITIDAATCNSFIDIEAEAVAHMNEDHSDSVALYASALLNQDNGPWTLANLDPEGLDLVLENRSARLWFDPPLASADELRPRLITLAQSARQKNINA